jgi:putative transposase
MKESRFSDQQIAFALPQAETGTSVADVCRKLGISEATFYRWKERYGGLMPSEVRKLKHLEEENGRLRRLVSDLSLDKEMLQEVLRKKFKACTGTGAGGPYTHLLSGRRPAGLPCANPASVDVPI